MYDCKNYRRIENDKKTHIAMANFAHPADILWDTSPAADRDQRADFDARSANRDRLVNGDACPDSNAYPNGYHLANPKLRSACRFGTATDGLCQRGQFVCSRWG